MSALPTELVCQGRHNPRGNKGRATGWKVGNTSSPTPFSLKIGAVREFGLMVSNVWSANHSVWSPGITCPLVVTHSGRPLLLDRTFAIITPLRRPEATTCPTLKIRKKTHPKRASRLTPGLLCHSALSRRLRSIRPTDNHCTSASGRQAKQAASGVNRRHFWRQGDLPFGQGFGRMSRFLVAESGSELSEDA